MDDQENGTAYIRTVQLTGELWRLVIGMEFVKLKKQMWLSINHDIY